MDDLEPMSPQESWTCEQCGHMLDVHERCPKCEPVRDRARRDVDWVAATDAKGECPK